MQGMVAKPVKKTKLLMIYCYIMQWIYCCIMQRASVNCLLLSSPVPHLTSSSSQLLLVMMIFSHQGSLPHLGGRCWGQLRRSRYDRYGFVASEQTDLGGGVRDAHGMEEGYCRVVLNLQDGREASKGGPQFQAFNIEDTSEDLGGFSIIPRSHE